LEISFKNQKYLLARISGIQSSPSHSTSTFLQYLEVGLINNYNELLRLEKDIWRLKSCVNWLQQRDANTKFYHLTTLQRRRRNRITTLKDTSGNWTLEQSQVNEMIQHYYKNLFTITHNHSKKYYPISPYNTITTSIETDSCHYHNENISGSSPISTTQSSRAGWLTALLLPNILGPNFHSVISFCNLAFTNQHIPS